jgi:hypothetical protein
MILRIYTFYARIVGEYVEESPDLRGGLSEENIMTEKLRGKAPTHDTGLVDRSGTFWTQSIEPKGAALLSQTLLPSHFIIKNHGPETVRLVAEQGDLMDLSPGTVRITYAHGTVRVENRSEKSVLIEFEVLPIYKK